jgi:hypothetical protein
MTFPPGHRIPTFEFEQGYIGIVLDGVLAKTFAREACTLTRDSVATLRPLGRRTHLRLAAQSPSITDPHRPPRRLPRRLPRPRLLPDLLATPGDVNELAALVGD